MTLNHIFHGWLLFLIQQFIGYERGLAAATSADICHNSHFWNNFKGFSSNLSESESFERVFSCAAGSGSEVSTYTWNSETSKCCQKLPKKSLSLKMGGGVKGHLKLFIKFIQIGNDSLRLHEDRFKKWRCKTLNFKLHIMNWPPLYCTNLCSKLHYRSHLLRSSWLIYSCIYSPEIVHN